MSNIKLDEIKILEKFKHFFFSFIQDPTGGNERGRMKRPIILAESWKGKSYLKNPKM